jgi:hypothetical protein
MKGALAMHRLCDFIDDELMDMEDLIKQGKKLSMSEVDYGDKLAHFKKCLLTNKAMEDNYSEARGGRSNRMGRSYDDMSMARNRDSMGRYSRDEFMDKLTMMRESAPNEKSRRAIDKMIDELEN